MSALSEEDGRAAEGRIFGGIGRFTVSGTRLALDPVPAGPLAIHSKLMEKAMPERYILLVEDNADDAYLAMRVIGKVSSDKVIVARDGEEATDLLEKMTADAAHRRIRLVLLDLKLPKISGIEVLQTIRSTPMLA